MSAVVPGLFVPISYGPAPSLMLPPGKKDKKYRTDMARALVGGMDFSVINAFREQYYWNSKFASGDQWVKKEDINTFLNDADGAVRNRIKANINIVRQVLEKYRGTASQMTFNASLQSVSPLSKTRRDEAFAETMFYHKLAQTSSVFKQVIRGAFPIGDSEEETAAVFNNYWVDGLLEGMNELMAFIAANNKFDRFTYIDAQDLALSGMCASIGYGTRRHLKFDRVRPDEILFDTQAQYPDMSDAGWLGRQMLTNPSQIFESADLTKEEMDAIERSARSGYGNFALAQQRSLTNAPRSVWGMMNVLCLEVYWRDGMWREYGYVKDEIGEPSWQCVNYIPPDASPDFKPKYTDADLISPDDPLYPKTEAAWKALEGRKKRTSWSEVIRYNKFVPWEYLCGSERASLKDVPDIELEGGVYELQEYNPHDTSTVSFPIKISTWAIEDGRVIAPISDVISPQRLFNRCLSVIESQLNRSGGKGVGFDTSSLDQSMTPKQALVAIKNGDPLLFDNPPGGINQAIREYDAGIGASTQALFGVMGQFMDLARFVSATPEGVTGNASGDTLVRVNNANIQGANLLDEVFYAALEDLIMQKYQFAAMAGKNWYAERPELLQDIVGNGNSAAILMAKDILLENVRAFVKRDNPEGVKRQQADGMITMFLQLGLLGQADVANLYNTATPEQVTRAAKRYLMDLQIAQRESQREAQNMQQMQSFALRDAELRANENMVYQNQVDAAKNDANNTMKRQANYDRAAAKAMFEPQEPVQQGENTPIGL